MSCRKVCSECPWKNENEHSLKFRAYVEKMRFIGKVENHKCHMISSDVWGYESEIDEKNVCKGHQNFTQKNNKISMEKIEIRTLFTELTFTGLCKNGFMIHNSALSGKYQVNFTKEDIKILIGGKILEKEYDDAILKFALQDIGLEMIREILKRSPLYFDISQEI